MRAILAVFGFIFLGVCALVLFSPFKFRIVLTPRFVTAEAPILPDARFRNHTRDLRDANEIERQPDGSLLSDVRETIPVSTDPVAIQKSIDRVARSECDRLLFYVAASCSLETFSVSAPQHGMTPIGDDTSWEDVFMRFRVRMKPNLK